jgi:hypothetical protein
MKIGCLVTGPNASAKTTSLLTATEDYVGDPRLRVLYADNSNRKEFKCEAEEAANRIEAIWRSDVPVVIAEGTRMPTVLHRVVARNPDERQVMAFVTLTTAEVMEANVRARCAKKGKRYRDDYWTPHKFDYEGTRRYRLSVPRFIPDEFIQWFEMDTSYTNAPAMIAAIRSVVVGALGEPQVAAFELRA